ncbi:MAG: molybdopterin-dependent oxidoreductase [Spirochaetes bacterium]|nr:molybdopterin-dependent oxidoreductase [Spirochaetota bacterium]
MKKIDRKDFLTLTGGAVVGGLTGTVFSGAPFDALQWLVEWTQDQHRPPVGREHFIRTVCDQCRDRCELSIRMSDDRAVMVQTSNTACPLGQNALQLLYHSERIQQPLKRDGRKGSGRWTPVSWDQALTDIAAKVREKAQANKRHLIAGISREYNLSSALLDRLVAALGSRNSYYEATLESLTTAALGGVPQYDFENTDYILSFGARILEGWGQPNSILKAFKGWKERGTRFVMAETNMSRTASLADEWVPVKPGTELFLALGIAYVLVREKGRNSAGTGFAGWVTYINDFTPEQVAGITGVSAEKIREIADAFSRAARPVAVCGRGIRGISSSAAEITAVYALNSLVNTRAASLSQFAGLGNPPMSQEASQSYDANEAKRGLDEFIKDGNFELVFINGANPLHRSVYGENLKAKLENAFVVSVMPLVNDTALYSDYILPSLSFLETRTSAGDAVTTPYGQSRPAGQALLDLAAKIDEVRGAFPWGGFAELVGNAPAMRPAGNFAFNNEALKSQITLLKKLISEDRNYPLSLIPCEHPLVGDGDGLAFPYVLKNIDNYTYSLGKLWVLINRQTADAEGVSEGERIDIESSRGEIGSVRAHLTDTVAPGVVAIPLGFGQRANTKYAEDKGVNPKEIMSAEIDPLTGCADWWLTRVKID